MSLEVYAAQLALTVQYNWYGRFSGFGGGPGRGPCLSSMAVVAIIQE